VAIWWKIDFYTATIVKIDLQRWRPFYVRYLDGEHEWLDLANYKFFIGTAEETASEAEDDNSDVEGDLNVSKLLKDITVGTWVSIWWEDDGCYYSAKVSQIKSERRKPYRLQYRNDVIEWVDLTKYNFFVGDAYEDDLEDKQAENAEVIRTRSSTPVEKTMETEAHRTRSSALKEETVDTSKVAVGTVLAVKWTVNNVFYEAEVIKIDPKRKIASHKIRFRTDGVTEWVRLTKDKVRLYYSAEMENEASSNRSEEESDPEEGRPPLVLPKGSIFYHLQPGVKDTEEILRDESNIVKGTRVSIYMEEDDMDRKATVVEINWQRAKSYLLEFENGDCEWIDFANYDWIIIPKTRRKKKPSAREEPEKTGNSVSGEDGNRIDNERWEMFFDQLSRYKSKHGHCRVKADEDEKLCNWSRAQRYALSIKIREGKLSSTSSERVARLNKIGFEWPKKREDKSEEPTTASESTPTSRQPTPIPREPSPTTIESISDVSNVKKGSRLSFYTEEDQLYESWNVVKTDPKNKKAFWIENDKGVKEWTDDITSYDFAILDSISPESIDALSVDCRLFVWWPGEKKFYSATLKRVDRRLLKRPHYLKYDDGDKEWTNLRDRYFELVEG